MRWRYVTRVPESFAAKVATWFAKEEWMTFELDTDSVDQHSVWKTSAGEPVRRTDVSEGADALALYEMSDVFAEDDADLDMFRFDFCDGRTTLLACSVEWMTSCEKVDDEFDSWVHFVAWVHDTVVSRVGRVAFALMQQEHGPNGERRCPEQHDDDDRNSTPSADGGGGGREDDDDELTCAENALRPWEEAWPGGDAAAEVPTSGEEPVDREAEGVQTEPSAPLTDGDRTTDEDRPSYEDLVDVRPQVDVVDGALVRSIVDVAGAVEEATVPLGGADLGLDAIDGTVLVGAAGAVEEATVPLGGADLGLDAIDGTVLVGAAGAVEEATVPLGGADLGLDAIDGTVLVGADRAGAILRRSETELARIEVDHRDDADVVPDKNDDAGAGSHARGEAESRQDDDDERVHATVRAGRGGRRYDDGAPDEDEPEWLKTAAAFPRDGTPPRASSLERSPVVHESPVTRFELEDDTPLFVVQGILPPALLISVAAKSVLLPLASGTRGEEPLTIVVSVVGGTPVLGRKGQYQIRLRSYRRTAENACTYQLKNTEHSSASQNPSRRHAQGASSRIRNRERTKSLNFMRFR